LRNRVGILGLILDLGEMGTAAESTPCEHLPMSHHQGLDLTCMLNLGDVPMLELTIGFDPLLNSLDL
jgi:hypothetical protein